MKNTENTKNAGNTKNTGSKSTMANLKRARHINFYNEDTKCTESILIVAESDKAYKTADDKVVKKADVEKRQVLKNTIDYRYNTSEEDEKFTKIQERLCKILEIDLASDIRAFESIFQVRQTKRYYNILVSDSVILNRASSIELLLTEADKAKLEKEFECTAVEKTETKLDKYTKHIKVGEDDNIYSLVLKTKEDIKRAAALLKK